MAVGQLGAGLPFTPPLPTRRSLGSGTGPAEDESSLTAHSLAQVQDKWET
jgi:hypothetical protein